jgi:pyruvate dehydrogenase E2 component (dihydrolipoamide acetyltransferase)
MATPIKMPDLGTTVEVVTLVAWLKKEGEPVKRGEPLCEVETDKATDQLESVAAGVLLRQVVPAMTEVRSGTVIAYIGSPGEVTPDESVTEGPPALVPGPSPKTGEGSKTAEAQRKIPPVIRNLARREGVNLDAVVGSGPGGQITRDDVLRAKQTSAPVGQSGVPYSKEQLSVARRVARSNREIPTVDMMASIDMSAILRARQKLQAERVRKIAFDSFFLLAVARSIEKFPNFAAHADDECLHRHETIDVCVAISHEGRLYLPAVRNANRLSIEETQAEIDRLVEKTRSGHLGSADLAGGCFTVSNLGMYPLDSFQMIIPPEQIGALAVGATQQRPVVQDGQIVVRPMCIISLSVDHRPINGAEAAEFLKHLKDTLEQL